MPASPAARDDGARAGGREPRGSDGDDGPPSRAPAAAPAPELPLEITERVLSLALCCEVKLPRAEGAGGAEGDGEGAAVAGGSRDEDGGASDDGSGAASEVDAASESSDSEAEAKEEAAVRDVAAVASVCRAWREAVTAPELCRNCMQRRAQRVFADAVVREAGCACVEEEAAQAGESLWPGRWCLRCVDRHRDERLVCANCDGVVCDRCVFDGTFSGGEWDSDDDDVWLSDTCVDGEASGELVRCGIPRCPRLLVPAWDLHVWNCKVWGATRATGTARSCATGARSTCALISALSLVEGSRWMGLTMETRTASSAAQTSGHTISSVHNY